MYTRKVIQSIMRRWKEESKIEHIILYRLHRSTNEYTDAKLTLTICTDRPGLMIGYLGNRVEKYRKKISDVVKENVYIEFVETDNLV